VFTNFQSNSSGCSLSAPGVATACAAAFTPTAGYSMTDAHLKVENLGFSFQGNFDLYLYSDNSGLPGSSLGLIGTGSARLRTVS
jgi:hypothetical protein